MFKIITLVSPAHMELEFSAGSGKPLHLEKGFFSIRNRTAATVTKGGG